MNKLKAILVDDEPLAREDLKLMLEQDERFTVVTQFDNALACLTHYQSFEPDVLFVDIQMPKVTGLELLAMMTAQKRPLVVLVTAYENYALEAFENAAFDYLLKPLDEERLKKTLDRLAAHLQPKETDPAKPPCTLLPCYSHQQQQWVRCDAIEYAFSDLSGVHIHDGQQLHHTQLTLKNLEQKLGLIRCHRQYLINPNAIHTITLDEDGHAQLTTTSQSQIPVSRRYLKTLRTLFALSAENH